MRLLGVYDSRIWGTRAKFHLYQATFQVEPGNGEPIAGPETTDVGFFPEDSLPDLSVGHQLRVPLVFKQLRGEAPIPHFDAQGATGPGSDSAI